MYREDLFGPTKYPTIPHRGKEFNVSFFGPELLQEGEVNDGFVEVFDDGTINLFPTELFYVDVCNYDRRESRYRCLDPLPPKLGDKECWHGIFELDYPFDRTFSAEIDFCSVNDVVEQIQLGFSKMYANPIQYGEPMHIPDVLRLESLSYDVDSGKIKVCVGS